MKPWFLSGIDMKIKLVPFEMQRYLVKKLPWIRYHEVFDGGHLMIYESGLCEAMFNELLLGKERPACYQEICLYWYIWPIKFE